MSLLPPNATPWMKVVESVSREAVEKFLHKENIIDDLTNLWSSEAAPKSVIPYLAWALGVDIWKTLSVLRDSRGLDPRALVGEYLAIRKIRGTLESLERAYSLIGIGVSVEEWFEKGEAQHDTEIIDRRPHHFTINLYAHDGHALTEEEKSLLFLVTNQIKPLAAKWNFKIEINMANPISATIGMGFVNFVDQTFDFRV